MREINLHRCGFGWNRRTCAGSQAGSSAHEALDIITQVSSDDAAAGFATGNFPQINAELPRHLADGRRGRGVFVDDFIRRFRQRFFVGFLDDGHRLGHRLFSGWFRRGRSHCRSSGDGSRTVGDADDFLAGTNSVARLHINFFHDACAGGRNGSHSLFVFQFHDCLILGNHVTDLHENANNDAGIGAFTQFGKFYIHN